MREITASVSGLLWLSPNARDTKESWIEILDPETHETLQNEFLPADLTLLIEDGELVNAGDVIAKEMR